MSHEWLRSCEKCGNYTTGRLCTSCATQEMIDNDPNPPRGIEKSACGNCNTPICGYAPYENGDYALAGSWLALCPACYHAWEINGAPLRSVYEWQYYTLSSE